MATGPLLDMDLWKPLCYDETFLKKTGVLRLTLYRRAR